MPISNKDLGKYKRPGIFINEIDQSAISLPIQDVLINLVPGFAKKGPFNKPVYFDDPNVFEKTFGTLDRNLENKGSFFHRTATEMLQKGPIYGLNLLATDPNRDTLEWQAFSVSAQYDNGIKKVAPYERFFNRQDFWEKDPESFMDVVNEEYENNPSTTADPSKVLLQLTNMGEKKFTIFTFKSAITGFDLSAEDWYGGLEKVPLFLNPKDWISDYIVTVIAVSGDWTNYATLTADLRWGSYFNSKGLIKTKLQDFINDDLVNLVAYYDASLIPNFKDINGKDMYIKNIINNDTEKTGLFCYYNEEALLGADSYTGIVDLIGQTMVCEDTTTEFCKKTIDFISYKANLSSGNTYSEVALDSVSNVFGNFDTLSTAEFCLTATGRTAANTNWWTEIHPAASGDTSDVYVVTSTSSANIVFTSSTGLNVDDKIYFSKSFSVIDSTTPYYVKTNNGSTTITVSTEVGGIAVTPIVSGTTTGIFIYKLSEVFTNNLYNLNGVQYYLSGATLNYEPMVIVNSGLSYSRIDVVYLSTDASGVWTVKGTQVSGTPSKPNFMLNNNNTIILGSVQIDYTPGATPTFTKTWTPVTVDSTGYLKLEDVVDISITTGTTSTSNFLKFTFVGTKGSTSYNNYDKLRSTKIFTELSAKLLSNKGLIINKSTGVKYSVTDPFIAMPTTTIEASITVYFSNTTNVNEYFSGSDFLFYYIDNEFIITTSDNTLASIITTNLPLSSAPASTGIAGKYSTLYLDYYNGNINNGDFIYYNNQEGNNRYYLRMFLDSSKNLTVKFADVPSGDPTYETLLNVSYYYSPMNIYSDISSYKQTLELENIGSIVDQTNTNYFYVNNERYSEIRKGYLIEAYYDATYYEIGGDGYLAGAFPRKLVRVVKTVLDATDPTLKVVYTDGPIKIFSNSGGTELYTTSYVSIDNYVTEYNGVSFKPFVVHQDSLPNGTEDRLTSILNVMGKTTNLAKGLANKNRISWRYLVDSFGLGLTEYSKQQYADLCGAKLNCFGFVNMPSVRQFKTSLTPSFINSDRTINSEYVMNGGNLDLNPPYLYSFATGVGRSTVGYFFPYVKDVNDNSKFIPPSIKVAKAYMAKFTGELSGSYPWTIVAGAQASLMKEISTTEMGFTDTDLENYYAMGANPIVYTLNRGYNINSENTAQVFPISSLSYIHSREVLIELENRLYDMLLNYHWKFNTPEIRAEIKFRADQICKELLNSNALYDYKNVCDKTNNTDYIIDSQMGVLDTYIEIIKGMGIIVNNITILKKGTIQSGGFIPTT